MQPQIKYPPDLHAALKDANRQGKPAFLKDFGAANPNPVCTNCNDNGFIWIQIAVSPPLKIYPGQQQPGYSVVFDPINTDVMYRCKDHIAPCHVCKQGNRLVEYYLENSGLQPNEKDWYLSFLDGKPGKEIALDAARQLLSQSPNPSGMLFLYGGYGVGKTGILKSLVAAFCKAGIAARFITAEDYIKAIRATYQPGSSYNETDVENMFSKYRFLAIDELDPDRLTNTGHGQAQIFALLNKRYELRHTAATAIASNKQATELWQYLQSRLLDSARIEVSGATLRGDDIPTWWQ